MAREFLAFHDAAGLLKSGGVMILGTDTLPGFHCRADLSDPVARILDIKGREPDKSLLVLAGSVAQAFQVAGTLDERQTSSCQRCWPGPFSLVLPSGGDLSPLVSARNGTVAIRVPALESLRLLILEVGFPLVSTSVNRSGDSPLDDLETARALFGDLVDGCLGSAEKQKGSSPSGEGRPSALIDLTVWPFVQLRPGPLNPPGVEPGTLDGGTRGI